jgi:hypothetical protein
VSDSRIYLVEVLAAHTATNTPVWLRWSTAGYNSLPTDNPANTHFAPRVKQPALIRRDMFSNGAAFGPTRIGYGEVVLANTDGGLDNLVTDYSLGKRHLRVRIGEQGAALSSFTYLFFGVAQSVEVTTSTVTIRVSDNLVDLDKPLQQNLYLGNNSPPNGAEGTEFDLKSQRKPLIYGMVQNIHPVLVNTSKLTFQVHDGAVTLIQDVRDMGVSLTSATPDAANLAALEAATVPSGQYLRCPSLGLFRLGSNHVGEVTCDVIVEDINDPDTLRPPYLMEQVAQRMGLAFDTTDLAAMQAVTQSLAGVYVQDSTKIGVGTENSGTTALQVMDQLAQAAGLWYGFDQAGTLRMGRLEAPSGTPVAELTVSNIINLEKVNGTDELGGVPVYQVATKYKKYYTVQNDSDLAGSVSMFWRSQYAMEHRTATVTDTAVQTLYRDSKELQRELAVYEQSVAITEATRLLNLLKVPRQTFTVTVRLTDTDLLYLDLGKIVNLNFPRFGLTGGKLMVVTGLTVNLQLRRAELTLWG